ncbi:MAG: type VI secretion system tip protein TssI/VgrG [Pseudomonadota bacterium]
MADTPYPFRLSTTLGPDALKFLSLSATEELGRLFSFDVLAVSLDKDIAATDLLGSKATVTIELQDGQERHFNGVVCGFAAEGVHARSHYRYRLLLRPWLWLATRRADTRIFQHLSVVDILKKVFEPFTPDFDLQLSGSYPPREYCVQYRETDFNFVSRLMEQEGIYYHFSHGEGRHTMVLVDSPGAHQPCPVQADYLYRSTVDRLVDFEPITEWSATRQVHTGKVVLTDYDFIKPATSLLVDHPSDRPDAVAKLEVYDYPGDYLVKGEGQRYARLRQQEYDAEVARVHGAGPVRALATGHRFKLKEHPQPSQNKEYLVVSSTIEARLGGYESGAPEQSFHNRFTAMDSKTTYRSRCTTPRPVVSGLDTAMVVGPPGEEIYTDAHGRIKLHFHWDRLGQRNENDTCWVRVSQPWAGKAWGAVSIPRIGQEVVVDYLEGDPDRPMVVGSVYNGEQTPPFALPGQKMVSGSKSKTYKGAGHNEMSADDTAGKEKIVIHAQYDMTTTVLHDQSNLVKNNRSTTINVDDTLTVDAKRTVHVKDKLTETVDNRQETTIHAGYKQTITEGAERDITGALKETLTGDWTNTINGNHTEKVTSKQAYTVEGTRDVQVTGASSHSSDASIKLVVAGSAIEITPTGITLTMGASTIKIDASGVAITAPKISLNG